MKLSCESAAGLVPSYLDGELSEAQAGPLRRHLLDCFACRTEVQGAKAAKGWFEPSPAVQVPAGFAARVARRAFAGDTGEPAPAGAGAEQGGRLLQFVLRATAVAAVLLIGLSAWIRGLSLPESTNVYADQETLPPIERVLDELDRLNAEQAAAELAAEVEDGAEEARPAAATGQR